MLQAEGTAGVKAQWRGRACELESANCAEPGILTLVQRSDMRGNSKVSHARGFPVPCGETWALGGALGTAQEAAGGNRTGGLAPGAVPEGACVWENSMAYRDRQGCLTVSVQALRPGCLGLKTWFHCFPAV